MTGELTWHLARVDAQRMKVFALLLGDPNPIHLDPDAVRRLGLGEAQINQGPSTMAMVYNLFAQTHPHHRVRRLGVRLLANVFADQDVTVTARPTGESGSYTVEIRTDGNALVLQGHADLVERTTSS
jgi:3-hydroxybutyryl-CoA dehydratase